MGRIVGPCVYCHAITLTVNSMACTKTPTPHPPKMQHSTWYCHEHFTAVRMSGQFENVLLSDICYTITFSSMPFQENFTWCCHNDVRVVCKFSKLCLLASPPTSTAVLHTNVSTVLGFHRAEDPQP
jgi:hypothetical protein